MPFTLSHAVVAIPSRRLQLLASGVAAGAIAADVPYYVPVLFTGAMTHTLVGVVSVDAVIGLVLLCGWWVVLAEPLRAWLPGRVRSAIPPVQRSGRSWPTLILLSYVSVVLGALTHVVWDAFTHPGRWGSEMFDVLSGPSLLGVPGHKVAQDISTIVGLAAIATWLVLTLRRQQGKFDPEPGSPGWLVSVAAAATTVGLVAGTLATVPLLTGEATYADMRSLGFPFFTKSVGAAAVVVIVAAVAWHLLDRRENRVASTPPHLAGDAAERVTRVR